MTNVFRRTLALTLSLLAASAASEAAAVRVGATVSAIDAVSRGSAVAYDSINHVYLVVSAHGFVRGRFVDANGTPVGAAFPIQASLNFASFPRVMFSPDANAGAGGFLVTWSESDLPNNASMHGRMVAFSQNGAYGLDRQLSADGNWWEEGPYIAYSTVGREFLVVYRTFPTYIVRGVRVDTNGAARDVPFTISQTGQFEDNPSVAYNPVTNQFLTCWKGYNDPARFGFVDCRFVQSGANQVLGVPIRLTASAATYITDTTYNPTTNQFLVTWDNGGGIVGRIVNPDGGLPGNIVAMSTIWHAYDALSVNYNRVSRTFFMVSHDARACVSCDDGGVEIADAGTPIDNGFLVTQTGAKGSFYPTIAASDNEPKWLVTTVADFTVTDVQLVAGTATTPTPPAITRNPTTVTSRLGKTVTFTAAASGIPAPSVQWQVSSNNGATFTSIAGANSSTYSIQAVTRADAGKLFRAVFTNTQNSVLSTAAVLIIKPTPSDLDGDGRTDALVWRPETGTWFWLNSPSSNATSTTPGIQWGNAALGDILLSGDIDGDAIADLIAWRPSIGTFSWLTSSSGYDPAASGTQQWGESGDVPMLADLDGDGKSDLIVWRPSTGTWFWLTSTSGYNPAAAGTKQWGNRTLGDVPLTGDFDADGVADLVIWRASTGTWFWLTSSSGYNYASAGARQWGNNALGDKPFLGDMDGDNRADLVVWRPSTGTWFWLYSSASYSYSTIGSKQWGNAALGDVPLLGDFDGDGRSDLVIWRNQTGYWYWLTSESNFNYNAAGARQFGRSGDLPIVR